MSKYLYEKDYKNGNSTSIDRKIFNSSQELFEYLIKTGETNFNAGCHSAEIRLNRIKEIKEG